MREPPALVAFDVDGTLLRGETICECIARGIGKVEETKAFELLKFEPEIMAARRTMAEWYAPYGKDVLLQCARTATLAPGTREGLAHLRERGVKIALVSITWDFAVERLATELGADYSVGTRWLDTGEVMDFWPVDKASWLTVLLKDLGLSPNALVAVGDSIGDVPMLKLAGRGYFLGSTMPEPLPNVCHWPAADIAELVDDILASGLGA